MHDRVDVKEYTGSKDRIIDFYKKCSAKYEPQEAERIFVATIDREIVGAVRLCHEHDRYILRTMQVLPEMRGAGIGLRLLKFFETFLSAHDTYCVAHAHLERFYGKAGFVVIPEDTAPRSIQERITYIRAHSPGRAQIIMLRKQPSSGS
jgi:predicted N-acetyltransferase YhbS